MVLTKESNSIKGLINQLNSQFIEVVNLILNSKGKVIITGIGKSAIVSMKISSTLNSTGTSSVFLHAADAMHGDLGLVNPNDLVVIISNSGSSNEIKDLVPHLKKRGNVIISITGGLHSFLAKDFASHHPGGSLGKKLNLTLKDLASNNPLPKVTDESKINEVIKEITSNRLGITLVMKKNKLLGIITDGDIRRMIDDNEYIVNLRAKDIMSKNPVLFDENMLVYSASIEIKNKSINHMILIDKNNNCMV